jgi:hypothetical protein
MKVIIVGGVAGGASCAARLRRLDSCLRSQKSSVEYFQSHPGILSA